MSQIRFTITTVGECVDDINGLIKEVYGVNDVDTENNIAKLIEPLKDDLYVCIEYPYVDRFYRDTYYTYFSSKHNEYQRDCIRVTLFEAEIQENHFRQTQHRNLLIDSFRGYFVIRPTFPNVIGRTVLNKLAFEENDFLICDYKSNILVNGIKLDIRGFPFSSQDEETISCAETSIWALMEYFGNRYPDYTPANPSTIINTLNKYSSQRLVPSAGLNVNQISYALKEFGFGSQIYENETYGDEFFNIVSTYVESGIPFICFIKTRDTNAAHANLLIGHEIDENLDLTTVPRRELEFQRKHPQRPILKRYVDYGDIPKRFIVNDDNLTPYKKILLDNPAEHLAEENLDDYEISYIIVPLYRRIYLDITKAKPLILNILSDEGLGYVFFNDFVFRFFLTSSRSLKEHIGNLDALNNEVKKTLVLSKMPKFIWCGEIYQRNDFNNRIAKGLIIIDATEANVLLDSLIFAGYPNRCVVRIGKEFVTLDKRFDNYTKFSSNLR